MVKIVYGAPVISETFTAIETAAAGDAIIMELKNEKGKRIQLLERRGGGPSLQVVGGKRINEDKSPSSVRSLLWEFSKLGEKFDVIQDNSQSREWKGAGVTAALVNGIKKNVKATGGSVRPEDTAYQDNVKKANAKEKEPKAFKVGEKVEVRWSGDNEYYPAKIKTDLGDDKYVIVWDEPGNKPLKTIGKRTRRR